MTVAPAAITHDQLILQTFEESLGYWCKLKQELCDHNHGGKKLTHTNGSKVAELSRFIHHELVNHFKQQEQKVKSVSSAGQFVHYQMAQYALIALIDDQLLQSGTAIWNDNNEEREIWYDLLLEKYFFKTSIAGDKLIERIEKLVKKDTNSTHISGQVKQLAYIYLTIIWQGFKGRLHRESKEDEKRLAELKKSLIEISNYSPVDIKGNQGPLLKQPYPYYSLQNRNNASDKDNDNARLAPIARWHRVVLFAALFFVLLSTGTWYSLTWSLENLLDSSIKEHNQKASELSSEQNQKASTSGGKA